MKKELEDLPHLDYSKTCFFSNYPPKPCGIATFTKNLSSAMDKRYNPKLKSKVIAINDINRDYDYDKNKVIDSINKEDIENYIQMAKDINDNDNIKIVCVQHEFGIFGGNYGSYIIPFLETLKKPVVLTFHSVLPNPDEIRKKVVRSVCNRCAAIVVMANIAVDILEKDYGIEREKMHVVHHGIPNVPFFASSEPFKKKLGYDGRIVLSTFGLLSRGKGIEFVIKSLPSLVEKYPNLLYLVIGETHPAIVKEEGEKYRNALIKLSKRLGIEYNIQFINKYMKYEDVIEHVLASDIYMATNLERNQITSGTLIEAMGYGGKAIVSTKSIYGEEVLAEGRGITVEFKSPEEYTKAIETILNNPEQKKEMERLSYAYSRQATWSNVALSYLKIFNNVVELRKEITEKFPPVKLTHLKNLTDDYGMIQFANHSTPELSSGYTLDDNARALIVAILHNNLYSTNQAKPLIETYYNFIEKSYENNGKFKNNHKNSNEESNPYSEDSFGRALWSLGFTINRINNPEILERARNLFRRSMPHIDNLESIRAKAFSVLGLCDYYKTYIDEKAYYKIKELADSLIKMYEDEATDNWHWFEANLTYSNAKLPEALFAAFEVTKNPIYLAVAEKTLKFLSDLMIINGKLSPIGQNGWYNRNSERAFFDQQPIDATSIIMAYLKAYNITKDNDYYEKSVVAFNWFLGHNHLNQMLYDETTGGCFDGLGRHSLNFNQGAESTVAYLLARLLMEEAKRKRPCTDESNDNGLYLNEEIETADGTTFTLTDIDDLDIPKHIKSDIQDKKIEDNLDILEKNIEKVVDNIVKTEIMSDDTSNIDEKVELIIQNEDNDSDDDDSFDSDSIYKTEEEDLS